MTRLVGRAIIQLDQYKPFVPLFSGFPPGLPALSPVTPVTSMRPIRPARLLLSCALLAACADRTPVAPAPGAPTGPASPAAQRVECTAHVREQTVTCGVPGASAAAHANIYGGQGVFVKLTTTSVSWDSATGTFGGTVTVQNLLPYALGVHEGIQADSGGVKVFFVSGPTATAGSGAVTVQNADGTGALTATGQPFVKYAQTLAPQQVSDPRTWLFHLDPGVTAFAFAVYVSAAQQPSAFRIVTPRQNDTLPPDSVAVEAIGSAPPATSSIRARFLFPHQAPVSLAYAGNNRWTGKVSTGGISTNRLQTLELVAVAPADSLVQTVTLINPNHRPLLSVTTPLPGTVVRDTTALRVAGTCATAGTGNPCTVTARVGSGPAVSVTGASFDFTVAAPYATGQIPVLLVTATDSHGLSTSVQRQLYVETSPTWHEVASAGSKIEAASPGFLFYRDSSEATGVQALRLRDLTAGTDATVRADFAGRYLREAHITPTGVVFAIATSGAASGDSLMEYRNGVLSHIGMLTRDPLYFNVRVSGGWAAWMAPDSTLYLRNVVAGSTTTIATKAAAPDVAPNGDVVFEQAGTVKRYRGGVVTTIAPGYVPRTDGNLVVYENTWIYLYDGSGSTQLSTLYYKYPYYAVRNGWVLYNSAGTSGGWRLFARAPDGTVHPVSAEGPEPDLEIPYGMQAIFGVGDTGEVLYEDFVSGSRPVYGAPPYAAPTDVGGTGRYEFFGSTLYVWLGRSLFQVVP